jgi:protein-S-isoprenylcysteine O-methyltransferase Ste14
MTPPSSQEMPQPEPVVAPLAVGRGPTYFLDHLWRELGGTALYELTVHRAAAVWFLLLAIVNAYGTVNNLYAAHAVWTLAVAAHFLSNLSKTLFFVMATWIALVRSQPVAKAVGLMPRLIALTAVISLFALPFLPQLPDPPTSLLFLSAGLGFLGNGLAVLVLRWLGRSFSIMSEARKLVTSGPYRVVRHPLYVTEEIAIFGIFLPYWTWIGASFFFLHLAIQIIRLNNEEKVLRAAFPEYADYARRTAQLVPGIW